jgi:hypothetical protein
MKYYLQHNLYHAFKPVRYKCSRISRELSAMNSNLRLNEQKETFIRSQLAFNKDHFRFAKNLFNPATDPYSIDKDETEAHFHSTYTDQTRDYTFSAPPNLARPPPPTFAFNEHFPSFPQFLKFLKKKSSGSAAGPYGIQYKVYKLFPCAAKKLYLLCARAHREKRTPSCWGHAYMVLLTKKNRPTNHAKHLRNIACSST